MHQFKFDTVKYRRPHSYIGKRTLQHIVGIDSECYTDGVPFMFPTSRGHVILPSEWPHILGAREYRSVNFVTWNLRYDHGSFLHHLPDWALEILNAVGEVECDGWRYVYYKHKFLRISKGRTRATFWDIMPFYECGLGVAAKEHLGEGKLEMETKKFKREYVLANWERLVLYGVRDAGLTKRLADNLLAGLERFGMKVSALYSQAAVSRRYFTKETGIVDVWKAWRNRRLSLQFASEAYWGGKFEPTQRGRFHGRLYDINSAYPYEMSQLLDVREARISRGAIAPDSAKYGYCRVHLRIPPGVYHSVPVRVSNVSIFPCGEFDATITLAELEDLRKQPVDITPIDGFWLTPRSRARPYAKVIKHLWQMKEGAGRADPWIRRLAKKLLNAYYGSLVMLTPSIQYYDMKRNKVKPWVGYAHDLPYEKYLRAGTCWNPFYGAVITANTRLEVTRAQRYSGDHGIAVHTDSLLTTGKLPKSWVGDKLGQWGLKCEGEGLLIGSGIYDIGDKIAFRGLKVRDEINWRERLAKSKWALKVKVPVTVVPSLLGSVNRGKRKEANVFVRTSKKVNLNADAKRLWRERATAKSLLKGLHGSDPQVIMRPCLKSLSE